MNQSKLRYLAGFVGRHMEDQHSYLASHKQLNYANGCRERVYIMYIVQLSVDN